MENDKINDLVNYERLDKNNKYFWQDGLSIDETKMSTLIICLLVCLGFGGVNYIINGDITNNLTSIIQALIYSIAGVNIGNNLLNKMGSNQYSNNQYSNYQSNISQNRMNADISEMNRDTKNIRR